MVQINNQENGCPLPQHLLVFQQRGSGENKIRGIRKYGQGLFRLEMISIDAPLPPVIDDSRIYLPGEISADVVLDFLKHPDLSHDLSRMCRDRNIPVIASGKKLTDRWAFTPPT